MLYACDQKFDVTGNLENFCELNKAMCVVHVSSARRIRCPCLAGVANYGKIRLLPVSILLELNLTKTVGTTGDADPLPGNK
jgi:hypothetical protein